MHSDPRESGWYYAKRGGPRDQHFGPYTWQELHARARSGQIHADDLVWNRTLGTWRPASQILPAVWGGGTASGPGPAARRSPWRWLAPLLALLVVTVGLTLYFGIWYGGGPGAATQTGNEVLLEPNGDPGQDPFTAQYANAGVAVRSGTLPGGAAGSGEATARTYSGDTPALYGGSKSKTIVDKEGQLRFFEQNPDKAAAFCEALNSDPTLRWSGGDKVKPSQLRAYFAELTAVMLTCDIRVTNHGYRNGHPTTLQSCLQAGQFVLVDRYGCPRVRVQCGNPLTPPKVIRETPRYTGQRWESFNPATVIIIKQTTVIIQVYTIIDVDTHEDFGRPAGSSGQSDGPAPPRPSTTTTSGPGTTSLPSSSTSTSAAAGPVTGDQLAGSWSGTLTIREMNLDQQATSGATQLGIPVTVLKLLKGIPVPFTMQITMDAGGTSGTAVAQMKIPLIPGTAGAVGSPITLPFTYDGTTMTFDTSQATQQGQTTTMTATVSRPDKTTLKLTGSVESSGNGTSLKADWQVTKKQ